MLSSVSPAFPQGLTAISRRFNEHQKPGPPDGDAGTSFNFAASTAWGTEEDLSREDDFIASPALLANDDEGTTVAAGANAPGCIVILEVTLLRG